MPLHLDNARVSVDTGDGWQELTGITRIAIDEQHQPIDWHAVDLDVTVIGPPCSFFAPGPTPLELALITLRPHLKRCPLYVG